MKDRKIVSVIVPCRNEVNFIKSFINNVLMQKLDGYKIELIVADGISDDGTCLLLESISKDSENIIWIKNTGLIVSTGLNLAIAAATGEIIVRMDVHTQYSDDYVQKCIDALLNTNAMCVGGPWIATGHTPYQCAIASAFQSRIGSGGADSRKINHSGWVDTVYLGAWRKADLLLLGCFDEALVRNQDDELALRIHRMGGGVWQSSDIRSVYFPRASLIALFRQFSQYGYWKIPVIRKHRLPASPRHIIPFLFFSTLVALLIASLVWLLAFKIFTILITTYIFLLIIGSRDVRKPLFDGKFGWITLLAIIFMHVGYAKGFGVAIWDFWIMKRSVNNSMSQLTR